MENSTSEDVVIKGQPGLVLLPAKMYTLKTIVNHCTLSIPMSGKFSELYPDFIKLIGRVDTTDDFVVVLQKEDCNQLLSITALEILFASKQYPDLKDNQVFSIAFISFDNKDNTLHIVGDVLEFVE